MDETSVTNTENGPMVRVTTVEGSPQGHVTYSAQNSSLAVVVAVVAGVGIQQNQVFDIRVSDTQTFLEAGYTDVTVSATWDTNWAIVPGIGLGPVAVGVGEGIVVRDGKSRPQESVFRIYHDE